MTEREMQCKARGGGRRWCRRALAVSAAVWLAAGAQAVETVAQPGAVHGPALTYEQASRLLLDRSDSLRGDAYGTAAARDQAEAVRGLMLPTVSLDVVGLRYQKTYDVSMHDLQQGAGSVANQLLGSFPGVAAGEPASIINNVISELQQQLPGVFSALPRDIKLSFQQNVFSPNATVVQPIYMGGAIRATQAAAEAAARLAGAKGDAGIEQQRLLLAQAYFAQALAVHAVAVAQDDLAGYEHHLADARKLEVHGMISHLRSMEVVVARDTAARQLLRAQGDLRTARDVLAVMLHQDQPVQTTTGLFVNRERPGPRQDFIDTAENQQPRLREAEAAVDVASQGIRLARASFLPKVYAFGSYNMDRDHALPTQPDWVVGIGIHYTLNSPVDRRAMLSAAKAREGQAEASRNQLRQDLRTEILRAYDLVDTSRQQYLLLQSSIAAATENLRVHEVAFREGEASTAELIEARNRLRQARLERAAMAYQYDLALAGLLLSSGQGDQFDGYLHRADTEHLQ
ncbi:TolC family protein [Frateuria aurantia]